MDVRVVLELPAPGMQYAEESRNIPRKPGLFGSRFFHDTGSGGEKGGIGESLMLSKERAEWRRNGEGNHETAEFSA